MPHPTIRPAATWRALCAGAALSAATAAVAAEYRFVELPTLGGSASQPAHVGPSRVVVGRSRIAGDLALHAVRWDRGVATDLDPGGENSEARHVNAAGTIVGQRLDPGSGQTHATMWRDGAVIDLGTLGGLHSDAQGINEAGQIVGFSLRADAGWHAALWDGAGGVVDLGALPGNTHSYAIAINAAGDVVGYANAFYDTMIRPVRWQAGQIAELGTLGGDDGFAEAINDAGVVVGCSQRPRGDAMHATRWSEGTRVDLGLPDEQSSCARGINAAGVVVGTVSLPGRHGDKAMRAVIWDGTTMVDLNTVIDHAARQAGWVLMVANGINDDGVIVGEARNKITGVAQAGFLLKPRWPSSGAGAPP